MIPSPYRPIMYYGSALLAAEILYKAFFMQ